MADNINKRVSITISAVDETGTGIGSVATNLTALQTSITNIMKGISNLADVSDRIAVSLSKVDFKNTGIDNFALYVNELKNIDISKFVNSVVKLKELSGVTVDPSLANLSTLKELSGITFPSFQKLTTFISKLKEGGATSLPNFTEFANGLKGFAEIKIPDNIRTLAPALKSLKEIGGNFPDLGKVADALVKFASIGKLPSIGPFVKNLQALSATQSFPDLSQIADALLKLKGVGRLPVWTKSVESLKSLGKAAEGINVGKFEPIAKAMEKFTGMGNIPSITAFVNSLKKLEGLNIPSLGVIIAQIHKLGNAFAKINQASPFITAMNQIGQAAQQVTQNLQQTTQAGNQQHTMWEKLGAKVKNYIGYRLIADSIIYLKEAFMAGKDAIIEYDQGLKNIQAITQATDAEMKKMGYTIEHVASQTKFSATEISDGMVILGQAGLTAEESISAVQAVADLATGTMQTMQVSVDLMTSALVMFNIRAEESGRVADVFANAVNKSKLTIEKLVTAMNYVGPVAADLGITLEETAAALGVLSNVGLRASTMGTGLRRILSELADPSEKMKDAVEEAGLTLDELDPRIQGMSKVVSNLGIVLSDTSRAFDLFGKYGASAALALTADVDAYNDMISEVKRYGTTQEMARKQMEGLQTSLKNLFDKLGLVAIAFGRAGATNAMKAMIDASRSLADSLVWLVDNALAPLIAGFQTLASVTSPLPNWFETIIYLVGGLIIALGGLSKAMVTLKITALVTSYQNLSTAVVKATQATTGFTTVLVGLRTILAAIGGPITWIVLGLGSLAAAIGFATTASSRQIANLEKEMVAYGDLSKSIEGYIAELERLRETPLTEREKLNLLKNMAEAFPEIAAQIRATLGDVNKLTVVMDEFQKTQDEKILVQQVDALDGYTKKINKAVTSIENMKYAQKGLGKGEKVLISGKWFDENELAEEIAKQEEQMNVWATNVADIVMKAEDSTRGAVTWEEVFPWTMDAGPRMETLKSIIVSKIREIQDGVQQEAGKASISLYGNAGEWKKELDDAGTVYTKFVKNRADTESKLNSKIRMLVKDINTESIAAIAKQQEIFKERVEMNEIFYRESKISEQQYFDFKKQIEKESREFYKESTSGQLADLSAFHVKKADEIQKWLDKENERIDKHVKGVMAKENERYRLSIELDRRIALAKKGIEDPKEVLEKATSTNKLKEDAEKKHFAELERIRLKEKGSVREFENEKLQLTIQRLSEQYLRQAAALKVAEEQNDTDAIKKAREAEQDALRQFEEAKTAHVKKGATDRIEIRKEEYELAKEQADVAFARVQDKIAKDEAEGVLTHQGAEESKTAATLDHYARAYQLAVDNVVKIRAIQGEDNDAYREALKEQLTAEEKYFEERGKFTDKYVEDRRKALEDIKELETKHLREVEDYEDKITKLGEKSSKDLVKAQETYAEKVSEINEKLEKKLEDLAYDLKEKYEDYAEDRLEAEQEAAAGIITENEKIDDKIREVANRGKSDRHKDKDNEKAAADKLRRGIELLNQARNEGNEEALKAGKELLEQSAELYGDIGGDKKSKKAEKGLRDIKKANEDFYKAQESIEKGKIDKDKADTDEKYEYEKGKAEEAAKDELDDAERVRKERIKEIQEVYATGAEEEKKRHARVMEDFEVEKNKLIEILNTANSIIAQTTGNIKLGVQLPTKGEVQQKVGEVIEGAGSQSDIDWSGKINIDPKTGTAIVDAVNGQVSQAITDSPGKIDWKSKINVDPDTGTMVVDAVSSQVEEAATKQGEVEVPVSAKVQAPEAPGQEIGNVQAMSDSVDRLRTKLTDPLQVVFTFVGLDLLQQAVAYLDHLQDKTITVTTKYVTEGRASKEAQASTSVATAFNGGLMGFFNKGGGVFKKLASPFVSAGSLFRDSVPAMLSKFEFVHRARAVREYGVDFMRRVNNLQFPKELARGFMDGGLSSGLSGAVGMTRNLVIPESVMRNLAGTVDNSSISTYNVTIGDKALRPRGKVSSLTKDLLSEVRKRY